MRKTCPGCGETKALEEFNFKYKELGKRQIRCRKCTRLQLKRHYRENLAYYIRKAKKRNAKVRELHRRNLLDYLATHPCIDCGESDVVCLEFDHVRGEKIRAIAAMIGSFSWGAIERELNKCDVRCANCHRRKTAKERGY